MNIQDRKEFYEKLYFHELDSKEKIEARLKMPLTIFAIVFAMAGFLFNEVYGKNILNLGVLFWLSYILLDAPVFEPVKAK